MSIATISSIVNNFSNKPMISRPTSMSTPVQRKQVSRHGPGVLNGEDSQDLALYWDNEDDSFEVPDFHFDWGVAAKEKSTLEAGTSSSIAALSLEDFDHHSSDAKSVRDTPPSQSGHSNQSSTTSSHILSLTDASTASTSSLVPTPPSDNVPLGSRAATRSDITGGSGQSSKSYSSRRFQRVVSAPIARGKHEENKHELDLDDLSLLASTTASSNTITARPVLSRTSSASSVPMDSSAGTSRSHFVTPGLSERTLGTNAASTGRRLGGLSRFGGPARRVILPVEETEHDDEHRSPVLIDSPPLKSASSRSPTYSPEQDEQQRSKDASSRNPPKRRTPQVTPPREQDPPRRLEVSKEIPSHSGPSHAGAELFNYSRRAVSPVSAEDRPFRPFHRPGQENNPSGGNRHLQEPAAHQHSPPYRDASNTERPPPQPLRATHAVLMPAGSIDHQVELDRDMHELRSSRSAPVAQIVKPETRPFTHQMPQVLENAATRTSEMQQAMTMPTQVTQTSKRSFVVNGTPYERVGVLGKGGSSKVYSVLCPTKRVVYALKRVALDRADPETFQSYTNEIELLKRLRGHDRIIQLIDHQITYSQGDRPRTLMMVMECGEIDFAMLLDEQKGRPLNMNFVGLYWEQMLEAVYAVHQENVVHTDLKPANFVLVKGRLKIIDFGIAKAIANDTVNIQRDQQIGTVNYMSPEAIQRMNNQKVLKLSYPSDVWSLGCILYQMIYGNPPFAHIGGGPLPKMNAIADPAHRISFSDIAIPKPIPGTNGRDQGSPLPAVIVKPAAIESMKRCLSYRKEQRLTIPELLKHEFLRPRIDSPALPLGSTTITEEQMAMLVNFVLKEHGLPSLIEHDTTAEDLFSQLQAQNSLS